MEHVICELSAENFDKAVHGGLDSKPILPEGGDLAIYLKPNATKGGNPGAVLTFTVQLSDGNLARAQCVVTARTLEMIASLIKGWREGGHL